MYSVMIVDDEIHAVSAVQAGVDWSKLSIPHVYAAYSVHQAKGIFALHEVDILLCDIEMPQASGLELLAWVREHSRDTETIILTCHSDFGYAKQALQLGSLDYILKPVRYEELEDVIQRAIERIEAKREMADFKHKYAQYEALWSRNQSIVTERFWQDLLDRTIPADRDRVIETLRERTLPYGLNQRYVPVWISVQRWYKPLNEADLKIMDYALRNAAEDLFPGSSTVSMRRGTLHAFLPEDAHWNPTRVRSSLETYIAFCNRHLYCDLCGYVGEPAFLWEMAKKMDALYEIENNNVAQNNAVIHERDDRGVRRTDIRQRAMDDWLELLKQGAYDAVFAETAQYLHAWRKVTRLDAMLLRAFQQNFVQMLYHVLQLKGLQAGTLLADQMAPQRISAAVRSLTDLQDWVKDALQTAVDACRTADRAESAIDRAVRYIKQHLAQNPSREDIAKYVHLHPDYLSRAFKKETGKSIVDFMQEEKMRIAKELLVKTDLSVSGIAIKVGFSNFSYFAKMFKKATNLNPQEYRESNKSLQV